jgi:hypothetical protein
MLLEEKGQIEDNPIPKNIKRTWSDGKYDTLYELMG